MSLTRLEYKKTWTSSGDFPTYEDSEQQVRSDLQYHPDAIRDYLNGTLLPEVEKEQSTAAEGLQKAQETLERQQEQIEELAFGETPTVIKSTLYRENLLINADFRDPVDTKQGHVVPPGTAYYADTGLSEQAGALEKYAAAVKEAGGYGSIAVSGKRYYVDWAQAVRGYVGVDRNYENIFDKWLIGHPAISTEITEGGVKISTDRNVMQTDIRGLFQYVDACQKLSGRTVTVSVFAEQGTWTSIRLVIRATAGGTVWMRSVDLRSNTVTALTVTLPDKITELMVSVNGAVGTLKGDNMTIKAAKLELGDYQTLAHQDESGNWVLNEAPNKAKQLALCSQYDPETGEFYDELLARQSQVEKLEGMFRDLELVGDLVIEKIQTSRTWTVPKAIGQAFKVFVVGGGGGGGYGTSGKYGGGGGSGCIEIQTLTLTEGEEIEVVCGAGGSSASGAAGVAGGETSFGTYITAAGGEGGGYGSAAPGGSGGAGGGGAYGDGGAGQFGGGGGAAPECSPGAGGSCGGAGGVEAGTPVDGVPFTGPLVNVLFEPVYIGDGAAGAGTKGNGGSGGFGGNGGDGSSNSNYYGGGGGGGYCAHGGNGHTRAGGGGGGYCGHGGSALTAAGGGGGGFFCNGGNSPEGTNYRGGGGGGFFSDGASTGVGGNGGVLILYFKAEEESA